MSGSQIEIQKQIGDDLQELNTSLDLMKKSIEKKEIAENNSSTVSLIKEMLTNITTLDDAQDPKIKELLQNIDKDKKVTPQTIDAMVTKIIDIRLKILQDKTDIYTKETESKHQQVEKLISQKDQLNTLLQSINKTATAPTTPTQPKESRLKQNRKRLAAGGGLFAAIGLLRNNEDENGKSK